MCSHCLTITGTLCADVCGMVQADNGQSTSLSGRGSTSEAAGRARVSRRREPATPTLCCGSLKQAEGTLLSDAGCRFLNQNVTSRAEFTAHKNAIAEQAAALSKTPKKPASTCLARSLKRGSQLLQVALPEVCVLMSGMSVPFWPRSARPAQELAAREHEVLQQRLAVIIFIRAMTPRNHEVSGYIDFHHR